MLALTALGACSERLLPPPGAYVLNTDISGSLVIDEKTNCAFVRTIDALTIEILDEPRRPAAVTLGWRDTLAESDHPADCDLALAAMEPEGRKVTEQPVLPDANGAYVHHFTAIGHDCPAGDAVCPDGSLAFPHYLSFAYRPDDFVDSLLSDTGPVLRGYYEFALEFEPASGVGFLQSYIQTEFSLPASARVVGAQ